MQPSEIILLADKLKVWQVQVLHELVEAAVVNAVARRYVGRMAGEVHRRGDATHGLVKGRTAVATGLQ